jgi:hypothetical protein
MMYVTFKRYGDPDGQFYIEMEEGAAAADAPLFAVRYAEGYSNTQAAALMRKLADALEHGAAFPVFRPAAIAAALRR